MEDLKLIIKKRKDEEINNLNEMFIKKSIKLGRKAFFVTFIAPVL
jgi:hypothetical protein